MTSRWLKVLAALFAFALIAAACGNDDDDGGAAAPAPTAAATEAPAPAPTEAPTEAPAPEEPAPMTVPDNPDNGVTSDSIKVGWMGDLTGPTASSQSFNSHGIEAYFECVNEDGGILGRMIDYLPEDDQFGAETAAINFTKLTEDDKVIALLGLGGSHISTQLQPDVEALNLPVIGPPQTIDIQLEGDQYFNNLAHYGDQADLAAGQIAADVGGIENAVVMGISLEVPSGTEFAAYVEQSVNRAGGTYVGTQYVAPGATEVVAQMTALQEGIDNDGVNYVTLHGSPGAGLVVMQGMADAGITDIPIIGIHGIAANSIWTEGPEEVSDHTFGIHSFLTANNDIEASADMERCATLAGYDGEHLNLNFSHGFLNGYVFHQAIERAAETGELSRESLTEALKGSFDTMGITCPIDWSSSNHSQCGAAFSLDPSTGGMVPANPFAFYADNFDGEYGIEIG
ncbi:ABC transporter substrate-binding protein [Candidatus Poriferisocius sp.]|uniref:ABC transporter substrate-binding protein n=1 Tax=Candidatus Poriferisocius sp. TaxID=3101276 RepID=UPI003B51816F